MNGKKKTILDSKYNLYRPKEEIYGTLGVEERYPLVRRIIVLWIQPNLKKLNEWSLLTL